jgi:hypothetical protein
MINDWIILLLIIAVIFIEKKVQRKNLGIVLLHNNDHTLMKTVQYISAFFEKLEVHFTMVVIKEKKVPKMKRSTGKLFNIGYRQLPKMNSYLFLDSTLCTLDKYLNLVKRPSRITEDQIYGNQHIQLIENMCGIMIERMKFKQMDGFSNAPNDTFDRFAKLLSDDTSKNKYGGYVSTNIGTKYNIIEKTNITSHALRIVIELYR